MEIIENLMVLFEAVFVLLLFGSIIWGATSAFKVKGFIISTGSIVLTIIALVWYEKFLDYSLDNNPLLIVILLGLMALFLIGITIYAIKKEFDTFGYNKEGRKKIKNFLLISLKQFIFALLFGIIVVGVIFFLVWSSYS
ncbi:hypothetical protein IKE67_06110 [bacterium]|nr:hypothetical protein [bacterium]